MDRRCGGGKVLGSQGRKSMKLGDFLAYIFYGMSAKELEALFTASRGGSPKDKGKPSPKVDYVDPDDRYSWG